jgi:uncharacterized membrane protein YgcG
MEQPPPPLSPAAAAAAEPPSPPSPSSPFSPPHRRQRQRRRNANASPFSSRTGPLPSLLALLHALALAALVVYECIVGFPLAQDWRDAAASPAGPPSLAREADALWWLALISAIALLLFLVLGFMARLALALLPAAGRGASMLRSRRQPAQLPRQVVSATAPATTAPATTSSPLKRRLLTAAAWLPAGVIACVDFARLCVLASGNNKRRLGSPPVDCAAGPSPQEETREAFHPASPGGLSAPTCDRFRMAVVLAVTSVCFILLSLLWRATPRRPLSRLVLAPALSVVAAALLLAKPVTSLMLFTYVQREAFSRSAAGGGGGSIGGGGGDPWPGELVLALISLLLASLGAVFVVMAALALGAPWALCAAAERLTGWGTGGGGRRGGKRPMTTQQEQQEAEMVAAAAAEEREEAAAPPSGAVGPVPGVPEPGPYPRPGTAPTTTAAAPPKEIRRRSLAAALAALLALILLATQLPAAFGLIAPVVALSSFSNLWSNFWVDLDFAFGIAGIALFSLAVVAAVARAAAGGGGRGGGGDGDDDEEAATAAV